MGPSPRLRQGRQGAREAFPTEERPAHMEPGMQMGETARSSEGFHCSPQDPAWPTEAAEMQHGNQGLRVVGAGAGGLGGKPQPLARPVAPAVSPHSCWAASQTLFAEQGEHAWGSRGQPAWAGGAQAPAPQGREAAGAGSGRAMPHSSHTPASWAGVGAWTRFLPPVLPASAATLHPGRCPAQLWPRAYCHRGLSSMQSGLACPRLPGPATP